MEIVVALVYVVCLVIVFEMASIRGRNAKRYSIAALVFTPMAMMILLLMIGQTEVRKRK